LKLIHRILVVSSDFADRHFLVNCLASEADREIISAANQEDATQKVVTADLVFLDAEIIGWNTLEWATSLKSKPATANIPIVAVIGKNGRREKAIEAGCADILTRPFDRIEVLAKTETMLSLSTNRLLLDEKLRSDNLLDSMDGGIVILDAQLNIVRLNDRARDFLSIPASTGKPFLEILRISFSLSANADVEKQMLEKTVVFDAQRPETDKQRPLILEVRTSVARNSFREISGIVAAITDVTEKRQKAFQEEMFLNFISHKLRTPLAIVDKNASMLHKKILGPLNPDQEKFMKVLYEKTRELVDSFEKLLGFTMIKTKELDLPPEEIPLGDYFPSLLELTVKLPHAKKIEWTFDGGNSETIVNINRKYLDMVIKNIVENAIKFGEKDPVHLAVKVEGGDGKVNIAVTDNGPGVPSEEREKIFDEFYQVDKDRTLNVAGTGLGLAIAKHIVTFYGGEIGIRSGPEGSTVFLTLPSVGKV